ncbi:MAG: glycosyltransferase [Phycisphaerae bacterium]|nr:glycosyltransferase [Phycisphaerae bacterium]
MTYVSPSRGIAFIHVPRTGGTSLRTMLLSDGSTLPMRDHIRARDVIESIGMDAWSKLASIAVVRNPIDWMRSVWKYARATPLHSLYQQAQSQDFSSFVRAYPEWAQSEWGTQSVAQSAWLVDSDGRLAIRHVLRFENLAAEWAELAQTLGLHSYMPKLNASKAADDSEALTPDAAVALFAMMRDDYEHFQYAPPLEPQRARTALRAQSLKVVQVSAYHQSGGAARAAQRLHRSLLRLGVDSRMLVSAEAPNDDTRVEAIALPSEEKARWQLIEKHWITDRRSDLTNTWFSIGKPGVDITQHPWIQQADVVHLHWVSGFQSTREIGMLLRAGKHVVWTLHDEWGYTGGCHFDAGCGRWRTRCCDCPQLREDRHGIVEAAFADRLTDLASGDLTLVCPSRWLAERVRESAVFRGRHVETIANGIDLSQFSPLARSAGRIRLKAPDEDVMVLFASSDANERRKGFAAYAMAMDRCAADPRIADLVAAQRLRPVIIGKQAAWNTSLPRVELGVLIDDRLVVETVAAADIVVVPSLEDNLPNAAVEALACGTPVVGFTTGGIPEIVGPEGERWLVAPGDIEGLATRIAELACDAPLRAELRGRARQRAEDQFGAFSHALATVECYASALDDARGRVIA